MTFKKLADNTDCLFRYRAVNDDNIKALEENRLYFSTPINFNDPYDNLIFANSERIIQEVYSSLVNGMEDYIGKLCEQKPDKGAILQLIWSDENKRMQAIDEHLDRVFACLDAIRLSIRKNTKILCFSEVYDSMLMWSHYADNHKGFVLVYDKKDLSEAKSYTKKDELTFNKTKLEKVRYVDKQKDMTQAALSYIRFNMLPNMGDIELGNGKIPVRDLREILLEKAKDWSYEKEWRIIARIPSIEIESALHYISCKPRAIIIGSQCRNENVDNICNICREMDIAIYRIFLSETSPAFKLEVGDKGDIEVAHTEHKVFYIK